MNKGRTQSYPPPPPPAVPLKVDSLEQALLAALPLGPQTPAGGVTLPDFFSVRAWSQINKGRERRACYARSPPCPVRSP
jgi:hypothetical protein